MKNNHPLSLFKLKRAAFLFVYILAVGSSSAASSITSYSVRGKQVDAVKGEILVKFAGGGAPSAQSITSLSSYGADMAGMIKGIDVYKFRVPDEDLERVLEELNARPDILYAEPNIIYYAQSFPPIYDNVEQLKNAQWGLERIQAHGAWGIETGNSSAVIAVIDSGVDIAHPDLEPNIWVNPDPERELVIIVTSGSPPETYTIRHDTYGWNFVDEDNDTSPKDPSQPPGHPIARPDGGYENHGTHVAGISSAAGLDSAAGLAYGSTIMPIRALHFMQDNNGNWGVSGSLVDIAASIIYAVENGAHIINLSLGGSDDSPVMRDAVELAFAAGCILVGASGNNGVNTLAYPAAYPEVISVGALNTNDTRASFSNYGTDLDLTAPGVSILSTVPGKTTNMSGTSMAAPFVSGLAALAVSYYEDNNISWDNEMIRELLIRHADGLSGGGYPLRNDETGYGRINAHTMMTFIDAGGFRVAQSEPLSYPNPFNPNLQNVMLSLSSDNTSKIKEYRIYSLTGRLVRSESGLSGIFARWDGRNNAGDLCASGLYFYSLITQNGDSETGKITLVR